MPDLSPSLFEGIHKLPSAVKGMIWSKSKVPLASLKSDDKFVPSGKQMVSDVRGALEKKNITKAEHDNATLEIVKASAGTPHEVEALSEYLKSAQKDPSLLTPEIHNHSIFTPERVHEWTPEFTEGTVATLKHVPPDVQGKWVDLIKQSPQLTEQLEKKCGTKTLDLESKTHQNAMIELMPDMLPKTQKFAADAIENTTTHKMAVAELNARPNVMLPNEMEMKANDVDLIQEFQKPSPDFNKVFTLLRTDRTESPELHNFYFQTAFQHGNTDTIQFLGKKQGVEVNYRHPGDPNQNTLFLHAVGSKQMNMAQTLAEVGANVKATNIAEQSAMHIVADQGNIKAVPVLHDLGVPVDATNKEGYTPLHLTAESNAAETARALVGLGADINKKVDGQTPLDIALEAHKYSNRKAVIKTLEELGAKKGSEIP